MQNVPLMTQSGEGTPDKPWIIKTILFGDYRSGRNTVWDRMTEDNYPLVPPGPLPQIGIDFKTLKFNDGCIKSQIWNAPRGGERMSHVPRGYYRGSHSAILVVRTSMPNQLQRVTKDMAAFEESKDNPYREYILVSNVDKTKPRQFTTEEAEQWATKHNMMFVEVDATEDVGPILIEKLKEALDKVLLNIDRFPKKIEQQALPAPAVTRPKCTLI